MTVAATPEPKSAPPTPEECDHPASMVTVGVLAHEFSPYRGALGPEGKRRTTMYYGPVVGAMPIGAWHCQKCGLLRLQYYDGRREERRLFPGPQPGLLAVAIAEDVAPAASRGVQASVSGISLPFELERVLIPTPERARLRLPSIELPDLGWVTWTAVVLLTATIVELALLMYGAVYDWRTASWVGPLTVVTGLTFGAAVLIPLLVSAFRHFFAWPQLAPSPAEVYRGELQMDGVAWTVVTLLVIVIGGLVVTGILAIYDWRTPGIMRPLVIALGVTFGLCALVGLAGYANRHMAQRS